MPPPRKRSAGHNRSAASSVPTIVAAGDLTRGALRGQFTTARDAWLTKSPSIETRDSYRRDLHQFLDFLGFPHTHLERLRDVTPVDVSAWRDHLLHRGLTNSAVVRKLTVLRSLYSFLHAFGYAGANPAHSDYVQSPPAPRDGKTVALSPHDCRRLLETPDLDTPEGVRDRAMFAVLAYTGCRVGELVRLRVMDYKTTGAHKVLEIRGKGGKERRVPLHPEAFEALELWLDRTGFRDEENAAMFRPVSTARGKGRDGFKAGPLTRRAVQFLVARTIRRLGLDPAASVHSFRVTALTTARERGCDIIDLQDFAGHADPRTTLTYIRNRDRLSKSPAYVLRY